MSHPLPGKEMEFDLTRNDRFFSLKIPYYIIEDDLVLYEIHLKDLVNNRTYVHTFRFNNLKTINQKLLDKNVLHTPYSVKLLNSPKHTFGAKPTNILK